MTAVQVSADRTTGRLHLDFIDGLRGLAALFVVFHHVWQYAVTTAVDPSSKPAWFSPATVFKYGSYAVAVFIVVSGYCLMLPVLRYGGTGSPGGLRGFSFRRTRRIVPPYLVVLAASMALYLAVPTLRKPTGTPWDITLDSFTFGKVTSHLLLVHNLNQDWQYAFDPPLWTIALEFQIYFVFAILLLPLFRRTGLRAVVAVCFAAAVLLTAVGLGFIRPWMLGMFALGMAAAAVGTSEAFAGLRHRIPWKPVVILLVLAVPVSTVAAEKAFTSEYVQLFVGHTVVGLATAAGIVLMSRDRLEGRSVTMAHRALASRPARGVGVFSYSLYMIHYPVIAVVALLWARELDLSVPANMLFLTLICVPAVLVLSYGFHLAVERRFMNSPPAPVSRAPARSGKTSGSLDVAPRAAPAHGLRPDEHP